MPTQNELETKPKAKEVRIATPCRLNVVENTIRSIGDLGFWDSAVVSVVDGKIVISY